MNAISEENSSLELSAIHAVAQTVKTEMCNLVCRSANDSLIHTQLMHEHIPLAASAHFTLTSLFSFPV